MSVREIVVRSVAQAATFTLTSTTCQSFDEFLEAQGLRDALTKYIIPTGDVPRIRDQSQTSTASRARSSGITAEAFSAPRTVLQQPLVALAPARFAARPVHHSRVSRDRGDRKLGGVMRDLPANAIAFFSPNLFQPKANLISRRVLSGAHGGRTAARDRSSYGRRIHSKNAQVRFQESRCSGVSNRASVLGSTRRLNECPLRGST